MSAALAARIALLACAMRLRPWRAARAFLRAAAAMASGRAAARAPARPISAISAAVSRALSRCQHGSFIARRLSPTCTRSSRWTISIAAAIAEHGLDLGRSSARRSVAHRRRHRQRGRGRSRGPSGDRIATASPRAKLPSTRLTPAGSRLLPGAARRTAPASTMSAAGRLSVPAIQRLRAASGLPLGREPGRSARRARVARSGCERVRRRR